MDSADIYNTILKDRHSNGKKQKSLLYTKIKKIGRNMLIIEKLV